MRQTKTNLKEGHTVTDTTNDRGARQAQPVGINPRRRTPNPKENAMTGSTHPGKSNGLQGDLLSGEWLSGAPRRGSGQHVRLKPLGDDQRVAVPGMADFSGGGPAGTYCRDCNHFAAELAVQVAPDVIERAQSGCAIWAQRMAHAAPLPRSDIRLCSSCKHFEKSADKSPRCFIIDSAGTSYRLDSMPKDPREWLGQEKR
jgi:hypothetical protein